MSDGSLSTTKVSRRARRPRRFFVFNQLLRRYGTTKTSRRRNRARTNGSNAQYHLTGAEIIRLIAAARGARDKAIIRLFAETGVRRFELAALRVEDLRLTSGELVIRAGKGSKSRVVPIADRLRGALYELTVSRDCGPVFRTAAGKALSLRQINRIVATVGRAAGVENPNPRHRQITCHLFRHTFARLWKERQGSIETLARILGHSRPSTTWSLYGTESQRDVQRNYREIIGDMFSSKGEHGKSQTATKKRKGEARK